jgi:hypothetical protein
MSEPVEGGRPVLEVDHDGVEAGATEDLGCAGTFQEEPRREGGLAREPASGDDVLRHGG